MGGPDFRERKCDFSLDFPAFGPSVLDGARSKAVLRVGTDFLEFRQLQEVEIFSYLVYSLDKSHFMDGDLLRPERPRYRSQKSLNRVKKSLLVWP